MVNSSLCWALVFSSAISCALGVPASPLAEQLPHSGSVPSGVTEQSPAVLDKEIAVFEGFQGHNRHSVVAAISLLQKQSKSLLRDVRALKVADGVYSSFESTARPSGRDGGSLTGMETEAGQWQGDLFSTAGAALLDSLYGFSIKNRTLNAGSLEMERFLTSLWRNSDELGGWAQDADRDKNPNPTVQATFVALMCFREAGLSVPSTVVTQVGNFLNHLWDEQLLMFRSETSSDPSPIGTVYAIQVWKLLYTSSTLFGISAPSHPVTILKSKLPEYIRSFGDSNGENSSTSRGEGGWSSNTNCAVLSSLPILIMSLNLERDVLPAILDTAGRLCQSRSTGLLSVADSRTVHNNLASRVDWFVTQQTVFSLLSLRTAVKAGHYADPLRPVGFDLLHATSAVLTHWLHLHELALAHILCTQYPLVKHFLKPKLSVTSPLGSGARPNVMLQGLEEASIRLEFEGFGLPMAGLQVQATVHDSDVHITGRSKVEKVIFTATEESHNNCSIDYISNCEIKHSGHEYGSCWPTDEPMPFCSSYKINLPSEMNKQMSEYIVKAEARRPLPSLHSILRFDVSDVLIVGLRANVSMYIEQAISPEMNAWVSPGEPIWNGRRLACAANLENGPSLLTKNPSGSDFITTSVRNGLLKCRCSALDSAGFVLASGDLFDSSAAEEEQVFMEAGTSRMTLAEASAKCERPPPPLQPSEWLLNAVMTLDTKSSDPFLPGVVTGLVECTSADEGVVFASKMVRWESVASLAISNTSISNRELSVQQAAALYGREDEYIPPLHTSTLRIGDGFTATGLLMRQGPHKSTYLLSQNTGKPGSDQWGRIQEGGPFSSLDFSSVPDVGCRLHSHEGGIIQDVDGHVFSVAKSRLPTLHERLHSPQQADLKSSFPGRQRTSSQQLTMVQEHIAGVACIFKVHDDSHQANFGVPASLDILKGLKLSFYFRQLDADMDHDRLGSQSKSIDMQVEAENDFFVPLLTQVDARVLITSHSGGLLHLSQNASFRVSVTDALTFASLADGVDSILKLEASPHDFVHSGCIFNSSQQMHECFGVVSSAIQVRTMSVRAKILHHVDTLHDHGVTETVSAEDIKQQGTLVHMSATRFAVNTTIHCTSLSSSFTAGQTTIRFLLMSQAFAVTGLKLQASVTHDAGSWAGAHIRSFPVAELQKGEYSVTVPSEQDAPMTVDIFRLKSTLLITSLIIGKQKSRSFWSKVLSGDWIATMGVLVALGLIGAFLLLRNALQSFSLPKSHPNGRGTGKQKRKAHRPVYLNVSADASSDISEVLGQDKTPLASAFSLLQNRRQDIARSKSFSALDLHSVADLPPMSHKECLKENAGAGNDPSGHADILVVQEIPSSTHMPSKVSSEDPPFMQTKPSDSALVKRTIQGQSNQKIKGNRKSATRRRRHH